MPGKNKFPKGKLRWTLEMTRDQMREIEWQMVLLYTKDPFYWLPMKEAFNETLSRSGRKIPKKKK